MMTWFIDSWAVRDGFAFASEREAGTVDAVQTVFIAPPDFEPIPVSKISTALAAARGHFQDRLRDGDGNEIPFDTLGQIIELVRRSYLQGGSGFLPPAGPPGPEGPPRGERPSPPEDFPTEGMSPSDLHPRHDRDNTSGPDQTRDGSSGSRTEITERIRELDSAESRMLLATSFETRLTTRIDSQLLEAFVKDVTHEFVRRFNVAVDEALSNDEIRLLCKTIDVWGELAARLDLYEAIESLQEIAWYHRLHPILEEVRWFWRGREQIHNSILHGFFHRVPLPPQWKLKLSRPNLVMEVNSIGDLLGSIAADRNCLFDVIDDWVGFIPVVYCSLALAAAADSPGPYEFRYLAQEHMPRPTVGSYYLNELRRKAAVWLSELLPGKELDDHESINIISSLNFQNPESNN